MYVQTGLYNVSDVDVYGCMHNTILAHMEAYRVFKEKKYDGENASERLTNESESLTNLKSLAKTYLSRSLDNPITSQPAPKRAQQRAKFFFDVDSTIRIHVKSTSATKISTSEYFRCRIDVDWVQA